MENNQYEVIVRDNMYNTNVNVIFKGNKEDSELVYKILCAYHKYDNSVEVSIKQIIPSTPEYTDVLKILDVFEYRLTYEKLRERNIIPHYKGLKPCTKTQFYKIRGDTNVYNEYLKDYKRDKNDKNN